MNNEKPNIMDLLKNEKVEWKTLGEIAEICTGSSNTNEQIENGKYPFFVRSKYVKRANKYEFDEEAVIIPGEGGIGEIFHYINGKYALHQRAYRIHLISKNVMTKYLFHYMKNSFYNFIVKNSVGATVASIRVGMIQKFEIPIPSIETQEKIVKILDKFTNYVTELQTELQKRTYQYEFYRDKLLNEKYLQELSKKIDNFESNRELRVTTLGEIGEFTRGLGLQKCDFRDEGYPVIHYGQIYTKYGFSTGKTISYAEKNIFDKLRKAKTNDILIATTSENVEDVCKCVVWEGNEEVGFSGDMYSYHTDENSKYIAYYFQTREFQKQKERKISGTKLIRIHDENMKKFKIILPSIEIQNIVVQILDKFQKLVMDTKGLLPKEIEERQKQYEYYREKLLTFDSECGRPTDRPTDRPTLIADRYFLLLREAAKLAGVVIEGVEWKTLGAIGEIQMCKRILKKQTSSSGEIPFYKIGTFGYIADSYISKKIFDEYKSKFNYPKKGEILLSASGTIGRTVIFNGEDSYFQDSNIVWISHDEKQVINKFLYYFYKVVDWKVANGGTIARLYNYNLEKIQIPVPSLAVQRYVVSLLDRFDSLVNDISQGLPKEIEFRQKQYEYFREKLLSFKS